MEVFDVVVVVFSGYSEDPVIARPAEFGFFGFIRKPYLLEELAAALEHALR